MLRQRYVLALMASLGLALVYCVRVNLSVALIAMVNNTNDISNNITDGECPQTLTNETADDTLKIGEQFNWSRQMQGYILSAFFWGYLVLQIPGGALAQRYGGKWIFAMGITSTSVLTLLTPLAARVHVYLLIALRFLEGAGESVTYPSMVAMLGRWCPREENSLLFSLVNLGAPIGIIIGQVMSGPLCSSTFLGGWPSVFYITGGLGILWIIPWSFLVYDSPEKHPRISMEEKEYIINSIGNSQETANMQSVPWRRILLSRYVWVYTTTLAISGWVTYTMLTSLPQFLYDVLHFDLTANSLVASAPYLSFAIFTILFSWTSETIVNRGWMSKTAVRKVLTMVSLGGCGACLFGITFSSCSQAVVIFLLVFGYSMYSAANASFAVNALDLSPEYSGIVFGISNIFATAAGIIAPIIVYAVTAHGTILEWNIVLYSTSGLCAFGSILFLLFSSAEHQNWQNCDKDSSNLLNSTSFTKEINLVN